MGGTEPSPWHPHGAPAALLQPAPGDGQHHGMGQVPRVPGGSAAGGASITGTPPKGSPRPRPSWELKSWLWEEKPEKFWLPVADLLPG